MALALRWLRGRTSETPTLVELADGHVEAEELLDSTDLEEPRFTPPRGQIIRAYVRFLSRAREAGIRLGRHLTPREIQELVWRPEGALAALTSLFMDARYGPDEPTPEAVRRAEAAVGEVCSILRVRTRRRRSPPDPSARTSSRPA
jgi:hypothetical protein